MPEPGPRRDQDEIVERIADVVFALDSECRFTYLNAAAERSFHRSREALLGRPLGRAFGEGVGKKLDEQVRQAMESNATVRLDASDASFGVDVEVEVYPSNIGATVVLRDVAARRRAETALRESEERFRTLAEHIPQLAWMADEHGTAFWYNRRWLELTGVSGDTMRMHGWVTHLHPDHLERVTEQIMTSQRSGEAWTETFTLRGRNGQYRWFLATGLPIYDEHGRVSRWLSTATDVTERHWRAALASGERRAFELLAQGTPLSEVLKSLAFTIEDVAQDGLLASILLLDESGRRLHYGAAPSLPAAYNQRINGEAIGPDAGSCGTAAYRGEPVVVADIATDPLWAGYRDIALAYGLRACWSTPFRGSDGSILGTFAMYYREPRSPEPERLELAELVGRTAATIIERARADHVRSQLTAIIESSSDAIIGMDVDGTVTSWNGGAEQLYGWSAHEMIGEPFRRIVPADALADHDAIISKVLEGERQSALDTVRLSKNGVRVDVSVTLSPILGEAGNIVGVSAIARDNSRRHEVERLQREFLAMVTHELRNPIAAIKGYAQLLQHRGLYEEVSVQAIINQGETLHRLVNDLVDASRIQVDHLELELTQVDLVAETRACVGQACTQTSIHQIEFEAPERALEGRWDRTRIGQVLTNLLTNAIKYSPEGGRIVVRFEAGDDEARISVRDEGRGIDSEQLAVIFERFYRVDPVAHAERSLGLGLYISQGLVEAHGGRIWAESEGPGRGSTFFFTLPYNGTSS